MIDAKFASITTDVRKFNALHGSLAAASMDELRFTTKKYAPTLAASPSSIASELDGSVLVQAKQSLSPAKASSPPPVPATVQTVASLSTHSSPVDASDHSSVQIAEPDSCVNQYALWKLLGKGSFADVWLATCSVESHASEESYTHVPPTSTNAAKFAVKCIRMQYLRRKMRGGFRRKGPSAADMMIEVHSIVCARC
eukprot:SAG31_NODE_691_length_12779_cov_19.035095_14_plen_197_part_00